MVLSEGVQPLSMAIMRITSASLLMGLSLFYTHILRIPKTICCNNRDTHSAWYVTKHFIAIDSFGDCSDVPEALLLGYHKDTDCVFCNSWAIKSLCPMCSKQRWPLVLWLTPRLLILLCWSFASMRSHLSMAGLISWAAGGLLRKSLPLPTSWSVFPTFYSDSKSFRSYNKTFNNKISLYW